MNVFKEITDFYPTPRTLLDKITKEMKWGHIKTVLEPSAGKGDIVEYIKEKSSNFRGYSCTGITDIDCIEKDDLLQKTLKGKGLRLVHDDFLTYQTYKHYDLIFMNPPFSSGVKHLLKALDLQKDGGNIICILNAETIKNPYTNERKDLIYRLKKLDADITYYQDEFSDSERKTDVEIAVVKVSIPETKRKSLFQSMCKRLKTRGYVEGDEELDMAQLAENDLVSAIVLQYEIEVSTGIRLIQEYWSFEKQMLSSLDPNEKYVKPILNLAVDGEYRELSINAYVRSTRIKYWNALFSHPKFTAKMTSDMQKAYFAKVEELADYEFSKFNIAQIQIELSKHVITGIEDCIIKLFDELTHEHSFYEGSNNIHLYNGWKTNKAYIINNKVIMPWYSATKYSYFSKKDEFQLDAWENLQKLRDMEKALNYLDNGLTEEVDIEKRLHEAQAEGKSRNIHLKYFDVTFYKKGTIHIVFTNKELLKKLNIFGSQKKGWLPQEYGRKKYSEMSPKSREVVDSFEGERSYNEVMLNKDYYIVDSSSLFIEQKVG